MIYNAITLLLLTSGRANTKLPQLLSSCMSSAEHPLRVCVVVGVDSGSAEDVWAAVRGTKPDAMVSIVPLKNPAENLSKAYNDLYDNVSGTASVIGIIHDDMIFRTPAWDTLLLESVNMLGGCGVFYGDDCYAQRDLGCASFFVTPNVITAAGALLNVGLPLWWNSLMWYDAAKAAKGLFYISKLRIEHAHSSKDDDPDSTWLLTRPSALLSDTARDYYPQAVSQLKDAIFYSPATDGFDVVMTTFNRIPLLKQTIDSYCASVAMPDKIYVFDDGSRPEAIGLINLLPNVLVHINKPSLGCFKNTPAALRKRFEAGAKAVLVLDSDCVFNKYWWYGANALLKQMVAIEQESVGCLFNADVHSFLKLESNAPLGIVEKKYVGGLGLIITKKVWEKHLVPLEILPNMDGWDGMICESIRAAGGKVLCSSPSFVQHAGITDGHHIGTGISSIASDFWE